MTATSDSSIPSADRPDCFASFRRHSRLLGDMEALECMAQEELANHFSCLKAMLSSGRAELMADCAQEYRDSVVRKCEMAFELASGMVLSLHGLPDPEEDFIGEIRPGTVIDGDQNPEDGPLEG